MPPDALGIVAVVLITGVLGGALITVLWWAIDQVLK